MIMVVAMALAACGSDKKNNDVQKTPPPGTSTFLASGGTGSTGAGGTGGYVNIQSYGAVKVLRSGTVDTGLNANASVPVTAANFGANPAVVSGGTTTLQVDADDPALGNLCTVTGDPNIYIGDGDGTCDAGVNDIMVTGLTIDAGATLVLTDQGYWSGYGTVWLSNDLVINGTLTIDVNTASIIYIESNLINVGTSGRINASATTDDSNAGSIYLGYGNNMTKTIIVRVERRFPHPKFRKVVTQYKKFYAHDEKGEAKPGDRVRIVETRPLSKTKRWRLVEVLQRAAEIVRVSA